jgi:hypothetical protein
VQLRQCDVLSTILTNWTAVMAETHKSRVLAAAASLVKADGCYDLATIMREAVRIARRYNSLPT